MRDQRRVQAGDRKSRSDYALGLRFCSRCGWRLHCPRSRSRSPPEHSTGSYTDFTSCNRFRNLFGTRFLRGARNRPRERHYRLINVTLIVESRRSSAAARSKRVFTHNQPSFKPVPTVRPDSFASRLYRSLSRSYSSRVGARRVSGRGVRVSRRRWAAARLALRIRVRVAHFRCR